MTFTVTYRAKNGALSEETIEAAGRAECVAECRRREISPMSIREGRASTRLRSGKSAASPNGRTKLWGAAILAAVVLAVGVGVWRWFSARTVTARKKWLG